MSCTKHPVYKFISILLLPAMILPFIIAAIFNNPLYAIIGICAPILDQSTKLIKRLTHNTPLGRRPTTACDCSIFNKGGDYSNKPGFPSGHSTVATFLSITLAYFLTISQSNKVPTLSYAFIYTTAVFYIILTAISRVKTNCHTITQVIAGTLYGFAAAVLFIYIANHYIH